MAYEEVLFSVVFTGKKKYYSIPHTSKKVMEESMRLDNDNTRILHQIVEDVLKEIINDISQIDLNGV
ncbi:15770_t:CDS:2, partial [Funneliformis mosseae]